MVALTPLTEGNLQDKMRPNKSLLHSFDKGTVFSAGATDADGPSTAPAPDSTLFASTSRNENTTHWTRNMQNQGLFFGSNSLCKKVQKCLFLAPGRVGCFC